MKFLPPGFAVDENIRKRFIIEAQAAKRRPPKVL